MTIQQNYIYNKINKDGTNSNITTLNFDTTYNALLTQAGQIGWNGDEGTFNFKTLKESVIQLGQELVLYGLAGENIANGDVVMYGGTLGNRIIFRLARANTEESLIGVTEDPKIILGVATSTINDGEYGYVTRFGNINGIQTGTGWNPGDKLYFDIDASAALVNPKHGKITKTPSTTGNLIIPIGRVILPSQDTPAGRILVIPDTTLLLSSLADVNVDGITDGQYLKYENGSWVPGTPDAGGGSSGVWTGVLEFADVTTTAIKFASGSTIPTTFGILNIEAITNLNIGGASTNITIGGATTTIKLPSLISANGDLLVGTNSGSLSKLSMGGAGTVLKVNSSGTGLEWGTVSGGGTSTPGYKAGDLITSGVGYIKYNGTTRVIGEWDSVTETAPSDTTKQLNFNGKLFASQVWGAVFNDYAELFKKDEPLEAGDVVIKNENGDGYIKSQGAYDNRVVGVLSDTYSHVIGANKDMSIEENLVHNAPIGLAGRVYVKVIGKVKVGDLLVASPLKGVAMASTEFKPGTIIGKALEAHNSDVVSRIQMLILNA